MKSLAQQILEFCILEAIDGKSSVPIKWMPKKDGVLIGFFKVGPQKYKVMFEKFASSEASIDFATAESHSFDASDVPLGLADIFKLYSTVIKAIRWFMKKNPRIKYLSGESDDPKKTKIYRMIATKIRQQFPIPGISVKSTSHGVNIYRTGKNEPIAYSMKEVKAVLTEAGFSNFKDKYKGTVLSATRKPYSIMVYNNHGDLSAFHMLQRGNAFIVGRTIPDLKKAIEGLGT